MIHLANLHLSRDMELCIESCSDCHEVCLELIDHCLRTGGEHARPHHVKRLEDCAEICQTATNFMVRVSSHYPRICEVCAEICDACARDCEAMADDEMMRQCADVCRKCSDRCRAMEQAA